MSAMLIRLLAAAALAAFLWSVFRFAMGLRAAKAAREEESVAQAAQGRRVVAELPLPEGVVLFLESDDGFHWGTRAVGKRTLRGARVFLNDAVLASCARPGSALPPIAAVSPEDDEGGERWRVDLYAGNGAVEIPCGRLREGVSRETAWRVYEAVRAALAG
jgi:hypothetical protein